MVEPLRHRQTKEAATDMSGLQPPRHISTLPNSDGSAGANHRRRTCRSNDTPVRSVERQQETVVPFASLGPPDLPSPPYLPQGGEGGRGGQLAPTAQDGPIVFVRFPRALGHVSRHALAGIPLSEGPAVGGGASSRPKMTLNCPQEIANLTIAS